MYKKLGLYQCWSPRSLSVASPVRSQVPLKKAIQLFLSLIYSFKNPFSRRENKLIVGLIITVQYPWSTGHPLFMFLHCMTQQQTLSQTIWKKKILTLDCLRMRKAWGKI